MIRPAIGSVRSCVGARNRLPTMRVFGTRSLSNHADPGGHLIAAKYSADSLISSSDITFASSIIVFVSACADRPIAAGVLEVLKLPHEVRDRQPGRRRILGASFAVGR